MAAEGPRFLFVKLVKVVHHRFGEGDAAINRFDEVARQHLVGCLALVGQHVVQYGHHLGVMVAACYAGNGAEAGRHLRHPVGHHYQVGALLLQLAALGYPVERVHRIHPAGDVKGRLVPPRWSIASCREEVGILQCESLDAGLVALVVELFGQSLVKLGQAAVVGVGGAQ